MMRKLPDEVLSLPGLKKFLHFGYEKTRALLETGQIPARKVGKEWRVYREDAIAWIRGDVKSKNE